MMKGHFGGGWRERWARNSPRDFLHEWERETRKSRGGIADSYARGYPAVG